MVRKYFDPDEEIKKLFGHIARSVIFSQNGVRLWVNTFVNSTEVSFIVEVMYEDNEETEFMTLAEAMNFAAMKQKV